MVSRTSTWLIMALCAVALQIKAQPERWQQRVDYTMRIDFDVDKHQFLGDQKLIYWNNSPDTLKQVFYHLYLNAFQPGSMMDVWSRISPDPDSRVMDRISKLDADEIGYQSVQKLTQDGYNVEYQTEGTILEVNLHHALLPGDSTELVMQFFAQVPEQIRRTGRNNKDGVDYSMAQWYPKLCEYDYQGWHANPYVAREFYGVWGDYHVEIIIDEDYVVAGTGLFEEEVYAPEGRNGKKTKKKIWKSSVSDIHDFMWAADPEYRVVTRTLHDGTICRVVYNPDPEISANWEKLPEVMDVALAFMNENYGKYPYESYTIIRGGDGAMEYPLATLISGGNSITSLMSATIHEWMHSWYQGVLGSNESLYAWMDEGFTEYAEEEVKNFLRTQNLYSGEVRSYHNSETIQKYIDFTTSGLEEALSIHADHFRTNTAYGRAAYTKGSVLLSQLEYIMGRSIFKKAMKRYFEVWKFKHPNANDFFRVMEKESGLELDWFKEYFVHTTHTIDYAIDTLVATNGATRVILRNDGLMPMPLDVLTTTVQGEKIISNIPLRVMRGEKLSEWQDAEFQVSRDWPWTHPYYLLELDIPKNQILSIEIDPSLRMADVDRSDNVWTKKP